MADEIKSLDISDKQLLVHRGAAVDRECPYHHIVLLHRVSEARWIVLTHNDRGEVVRANEDLDTQSYVVVRRASAFPQHAADEGLLYFDEIDPMDLKQHKRDAKEEAHLQGGEGEHAGSESGQQLVHVPQGQVLLSLGAYQVSQEVMSEANVVSLK